MLSCVVFVADGGRHVDDSFDELGLLELGHGLIAAQELVPSQPIAALQRRDRGLVHTPLGGHRRLDPGNRNRHGITLPDAGCRRSTRSDSTRSGPAGTPGELVLCGISAR